jgi:pimeloyl-ACP methyl ester carboxylesterase
MPMSGPTSNNYFSQRLRLHFVDWGNPDAEPLLMVHGGRDHCRNWDWVANALRDDYHILAPDLRGHGDSDWMVGGNYNTLDYVYDIAQLVHQNTTGPVKIIAHSMGGSIALTFAGLYPELVSRLIVIEGMGPSPKMLEETKELPVEKRLTDWVDGMRRSSGRMPKRYKTLEEALMRMQSENPHLSDEQARHLTVHGSIRNEDGTYSWKFDNYVRNFSPAQLPAKSVFQLYQRISCPTLLIRGMESWASDPEKDGRMQYFQNARLENIPNAGHWVHHDQLDTFLNLTTDFLKD